MSPMMLQYFEIKKQYEDYLLFYRLGDFYEMFFEDAKIASKELDLTLTGRDCGEEERAPMCGVPYHACDSYIAKLIEKGYKVAICEQTEDPAAAKGIVKREVIRIITPGTVTLGDALEEGKNNFLTTVFVENSRAALAFYDISECAMQVIGIEEKDTESLFRQIINEFAKFSPKEMITNLPEEQCEALVRYLRQTEGVLVSCGMYDLFEEKNLSLLTEQFQKTPEEMGLVSSFSGKPSGAANCPPFRVCPAPAPPWWRILPLPKRLPLPLCGRSGSMTTTKPSPSTQIPGAIWN